MSCPLGGFAMNDLPLKFGVEEEVEGNFLNGTDRQPGCARGGGPRAVCRCAKRTSRQITCVLVSVFWVCSHVRQ